MLTRDFFSMATQRIFYKVLYDFQAEEEGEMSVTQGTFVQTAGACSSYPVRRVQRQPDTHKCFAGSPFHLNRRCAWRSPLPVPRLVSTRAPTRSFRTPWGHPHTQSLTPHSTTTNNKPVSHTTPPHSFTLPPLPSRTSHLHISLSLKMRPRSPATGGCSWRWYRTRASPGMCPSTM